MKTRKSLNKAVIEINEVEYLIDELADRMIEKDEQEIALMRLFDSAIFVFSAKEIKKNIERGGIVDYLD
jgi:hypothetical protein